MTYSAHYIRTHDESKRVKKLLIVRQPQINNYTSHLLYKYLQLVDDSIVYLLNV